VKQKSKTPADFQKTLDKTYRFLSFRPRSEKEIADYLKKRKTLPSQVEKIFKILKEQKLIDDLAFASWWTQQRETFKPKGKIALAAELRQKGVGKEIIEKALAQINEFDLARKALVKKLRIYCELPVEEFSKKISTFLSYRGFSWQTIKKILNDYLEERQRVAKNSKNDKI